MIDGRGRKIDYIRISLTDRCNLRCVYCMPEDGITQLSHSDILTFDEIIRIGRVLAGMGLKKIKLTGGEPLVRKNSAGLLAELKKIPGIEKVTLTTNGVVLKEQLPALMEAGLDAVNISLDTRDPLRFIQLTRRDEFAHVMEGIDAALSYPELVTKINCVPIVEDKENLVSMADLARDRKLHVRFIEMMPLGQGKSFSAWTEESMLAVLEEAYGPAIPYDKVLGNGPGHYYTFEGFDGKIGFISAVSHKFCDRCNRIRLTADGYLKACLQYQAGADLKGPMREGKSDEEVEAIIRQVLRLKPESHNFFEEKTGIEEAHMMAQIGG